jgi:hypothetical protein
LSICAQGSLVLEAIHDVDAFRNQAPCFVFDYRCRGGKVDIGKFGVRCNPPKGVFTIFISMAKVSENERFPLLFTQLAKSGSAVLTSANGF